MESQVIKMEDIDKSFLKLLADGILDQPFLCTDDVTATQVLNINTQQLLQNPANKSGNGRFGEPLSNNDIREKNFGAVPKKTRAVNEWAANVWAEWARHRNLQPVTALEPGFPIPEDVGNIDDSMLNYWGQRFVMEIRRKDGGEYPPNTLHQIVCGLQRYLRNFCGKPYVNFIKEGTQFNDFRKCLDTRMKELHAAGIGCKRSSSDPVTMNDEIQLWESEVFNCNTATGLSNAIFYYNGKLFGFRGFQEHISCQANQFEVLKDNERKLRYILFTPGHRKNSQGGLKDRKFLQEPVRHYEQCDRQHNLVDMYERYLSLIPRTGPMYRKPLQGVDENNNPRFGSGTISQNGIKSMIKRFFNEAGIDTSDRKITNHSARVALCTSLYNKNFADKAIVSRSKHRSNAVHAYQREQFDMMNNISGALEPDLKKPKLAATATISALPENNETPDLNRDLKQEIPATKSAQDTRIPSNQMTDSLVIHVPDSVKKIVIVKTDGKKMIIDV